MKLALNTLGCPDWSFDEVLSCARKLNVDGLEIRGLNGNMQLSQIPEFFPENLKSTKEKLAGSGVELVCLGTSSHFHSPHIFEKSIDEAKEAIDCANMFGVPFIRVFGDKVPDISAEYQTVKAVISGISEICDYAVRSCPQNPVAVLLEVHGDFNTIERLDAVCSSVEYKNFGLIWDVAHADRQFGDIFLPFYSKFKKFIKHVHIKDHQRTTEGFKLCSVGKGDIPLKKIAKTLLSGGYNGYFSLENEKKWHPELPSPETEFPHFVSFMNSI